MSAESQFACRVCHQNVPWDAITFHHPPPECDNPAPCTHDPICYPCIREMVRLMNEAWERKN